VRRLLPNQPSKAITGGALSEFIHPRNDRNLTLRECARIQTFPDDFEFCGTVAEQAQLIGNAVPPILAKAIARSLSTDMESAVRQRKTGVLLSFVPTLSEGMSPVLARIDRLVQTTFEQGRGAQQELDVWD
jgi:DNA (cytosine-5)-methyltransferase 1